MEKMKFTVPGTDIDQIQQIKNLIGDVKQVLKEYNEHAERNEELLAKYKAEPINVIKTEDIKRSVGISIPKPVVELLDTYKSRIEQSDKLVSDLRNKIDGYETTANRLKKELNEWKRSVDEILAVLKRKEERWNRIKDYLLTTDGLTYVILTLLLATAIFAVALGYKEYLSDESWAVRAYQAMIELGYEDPGNGYHTVMSGFKDGHREMAKGLVYDLEEEVQKSKENQKQKEDPKDDN